MKNKYDYKNILIFSGVIFLLAVALTLVAWAKVPDDARVPIHWNVEGKVDNYGSKTLGLLMGPGMILFLTILLTFVPRVEPRIENLQQSQKAYKALWGFLLTFMLVLHVVTTLVAMGHSINITMLMVFMMGILFMAIGNYLGKIRSNFMFGIRTPWSLSSEDAWNKTHRLGGRLFFLVGILTFFSGVFRNGSLSFGLLIGGLLAALLFLYPYSYWVWLQDDERKPIS